jgi:PAS domain S-box-containing protein
MAHTFDMTATSTGALSGANDSERGSREPANILVVDDEPRNLLALAAVLEPLGERVVRASSGPDALRRLLHDDFAVVLLDVQMPGMDGLETAALIRKRERCRHLPLIFITAISKAADHVRAGYALGAVDYVFKPYDPDVLRSKVGAFVDLHRNREQSRQQAVQTRAQEERAHAAEILRLVRRQNELILNSVSEGICSFDTDGRIVFANPAAARLTGWSVTELLGQPGHATLHHTNAGGKTCGGEQCPVYAVIRGISTGTADNHLFWRRDGRSFPVEYSGTPVRGGDGVMSVLVFRDVTERKRLEVERALLVTELEDAVRSRDDFLSIASHELKTPITSIRLGVQSLGRKVRLGRVLSPEQMLAALTGLDQQVGRLATLVEDLLDVSRIRAGRLDLDMETVELGALLKEAVAGFAEELASSRIAISVTCPERIVGRWDRLRVQQVVSNLLANAIKYGGSERGITVSATTTATMARLSVQDYGMGIAPEHQARIFERFERLVSARHYGGFGLGLWIVRQIAEAHGGTIQVRSTPGAGSTFTVELPRLSGAAATEAESIAPSPAC